MIPTGNCFGSTTCKTSIVQLPSRASMSRTWARSLSPKPRPRVFTTHTRRGSVSSSASASSPGRGATGPPSGGLSSCNKEGFRMPDKREKIVRQRAETRVGCRAMILVRKVGSGKWVVTKFVKEHTHPLTPGKGRKDLIYDQYPNEHDKIRELSQQLAIEKKKVATYKRHLEMIFEHIEEHNQSLANKIQDIVESVREMESKEQVGHRFC
ncbi:protein far1-related sequence 7 [Phtheirospermum japonicum]|uniref:Protein far1-related sequence 7 n=1 Tax=Phtheirospermum japonicum TaxID=374723 RepID=A0A830B1Q0_9LAMI|nr:protein far1-related sequence 7 [Phtheirospermum japonicum]